jgi:4'-phosphopantetheinyl transferase
MIESAGNAAVPLLWLPAPPASSLPTGEIHVFAFALDAAEARLAELESMLSPVEVERAARFHFVRDRRRFIVAHANLRTILGRYLKCDPRAIALRSGPHGRPELAGMHRHDGIRFNLSHSHELAIVGVQKDSTIGVDVERIRPFPAAIDVADIHFTPAEREHLRSLPPSDIVPAFFSYWTRREAILKSVGHGLTRSLDDFTLAPPPVNRPELLPGRAGEGADRWCMTLPSPASGYVAALSTPAPAKIRLSQLTAVPRPSSP